MSDEKRTELSTGDRKLTNYELLEETKKLRNAKSTVYVSKKSQYDDAGSTAWVFCAFGVIGDIFAILALSGIYTLPIMASTYSQISMLLLFTVFFAIGISSFFKAQRLKTQITAEEDENTEITTWLSKNITIDHLNQVTDPNVGNEINYLNQLDYLKERTSEQFPNANEELLEHLAEVHLNTLLDEK